ncbi:MAG: PASTA domain-containing protein, partial [Deltaproteobacteria bacterium]|nr:PASTA domain-containing protein [Deltaproteobacteria bacterium]
EVPSITGFKLESAQALVEARGLQLTIAEKKSDTKVAPGHIISQSPFAGARLKYGEKVGVVVAKIPTVVKTPALIGQPLNEAKLTLKEAKLELGEVTEVEKAEAIPGSVIRQSIAADVEVKVGAAVDLVIAKAIDTVAVPNVVGRMVGSAKKQLIKAGFKIGKISYRIDDLEDEGVVLAQKPGADEQAPKGSEIELTVSTY